MLHHHHHSSISSASSVQLQVETWKPAEINEYDEMERQHSLKQRESLIKGMGVDEIVYKMLSGTSGTVAAYPGAAAVVAATALLNGSNANNNNNNNNAQFNNNNNNNIPMMAANVANSSSNRINPFLFNDSSDASLRNNFSSKLELRTKNFNPFDNEHSLLAEVGKIK